MIVTIHIHICILGGFYCSVVPVLFDMCTYLSESVWTLYNRHQKISANETTVHPSHNLKKYNLQHGPFDLIE